MECTIPYRRENVSGFFAEVSPEFFRHTDVATLLGDSSKARKELGWYPRKTSFDELVRLMVMHEVEMVCGNISPLKICREACLRFD